MIVHTLFPSTVCFFELGRDLTKKEMSFYYETEKQKPNEGNKTSVNSNLLESKTLKSLNSFIEDSFEKYATNILRS